MNQACYHPEFIGAVRSMVPGAFELSRLWYSMLNPVMVRQKREIMISIGWEAYARDAIQLPRKFV